MSIIFNELRQHLRLMNQSQEILLGHAIFVSSEYGYHGYRRIARWISRESNRQPHADGDHRNTAVTTGVEMGTMLA